MKKIFGIIASLCLLVGCVSNRPTVLVPDPSESFSFVANDNLVFSLNIVGIETTHDVDAKGNTGSYLSGVVIKNTEKYSYILTAYHGLDELKDHKDYIITVKDQVSENLSGCSIFYGNEKKDIALLKTKRLDVPEAKRLTEPYPKMLDELFQAGSPKNIQLYINRVYLVKYYKLEDDIWFKFNGSIRAGNSGGGVFTKDGSFLGMTLEMEDNVNGRGVTAYSIFKEIDKLKYE